MRAKLIYSDLLYTASLAVLKEVKSNLGKYKKQIILVPDKYTLICENLLLDALDTKCSFDCEVMSINRLCSKVVKIDEVVNKQGGIILVQRILYEQNENLQVFKNMYKKIGFAEKLYSTLMQIKASGISPEIIADDDGDEVLLQSKIKDIKLIYSCYENAINSGLSDGLFKLEQLNNKISSTNIFNDFAFYFAFFDAFTMQEYKIIESLITANNFVCVGASYALGKLNEHIYTNEVYNGISSIFFKYNLKDIVEVNEVLPSYFEKLKNELFAFSPSLTELKTNAVQLYCANGEDSEVENVAKLIKSNIVEGKKYNQISVALSSIEKYEKIIEDKFNEYDIPYYIDTSIELGNTELGRFINAILKGQSYGFMEEDLKSIIFNYYFGLNEENKQSIYKFITLLNPNGLKWLDRTFDDISEDLQLALNEVKEKLLYLLTALKGSKTGSDYVKAIKDILAYFNVQTLTDELMNNSANDLKSSKILTQVYDKVIELLNQIEDLSKETEFDALSFAKLIQNGLSACKINLVPLSVDCVFVGDIGASSFERKDICFCLGLNLGLAPKVSSDLGIVTDNDIDKLSAKYMIEPKISQINMRARQKLFEICMLAKQKLILSYLITDNAGNNLKPSSVITSICKMFYMSNGKMIAPTKYEDDLSLSNMQQEYANYKAKLKDGHSYTCENEYINEINVVEVGNSKISKDISFDEYLRKKIINIKFGISNAKNLYKICFCDDENYDFAYNLINLNGGKNYVENLVNMASSLNEKKAITCGEDLYFANGKTSATQITEYYACPYKHFLSRGLKLQEDIPYKLNKMDIGEILHKVCELFGWKLKKQGKIENSELDNVKSEIIKKVKEEYKIKFEDDDNRFIIPRLLKEADKLMNKLNYFANNSSFKISEIEYNFKPLEIKTEKRKICLGGKIDRLDRLGDKYVVIDYKTGSAELELKEIYYGTKIQLLLYALAITNQTNGQIAGFGYYPIKDRYLKNEQGKVKEYKVNGYYLKENDVLQGLDNTIISNLEKKKESELYNFNINDTQKGLTYSSNLIERESIARILIYVKTLLENAVNEILSGEIKVSPYKDSNFTPCNFCKYKGICKKDLLNNVRELKAKKLKDLI
ncbi:MAG: PD-(D/E)XK nuclease family protein [Clostridia bacterium]|nr:PD-(D/E)XK nuclease family protein [Clostridia bacterium]